MRVLLDTDVTLDYVIQRSPFETQANLVFNELVSGKFVAYFAPITLVNVYYFARKAQGIAAARVAVETLLTAAEICTANKAVLENAYSSKITDYEDAVQHECAVAENLDGIVTRNITDYKNAVLPVYSPADFINLIKSQVP